MNSDAEGEGWFFRLEIDDTAAFEALMDQDAYDEYLETLEYGRLPARILAELAELEAADGFVARHIGPSEADIAAMLHAVGAATLDDLAGEDGAAGDPLQPGAGPAAADRRGGGDRRTARPGGPERATKSR